MQTSPRLAVLAFVSWLGISACGGGSGTTSTGAGSSGTSSGTSSGSTTVSSASTGATHTSTGATSGVATASSTGSLASSGTSAGASGTSNSSGSTTGMSLPDVGADGGDCLPLDGGAVASGLGSGDFGPCNSNSDCECPLVCGFDPTQVSAVLEQDGYVCVNACNTSADCFDAWTSCHDGFCVTDVCGADAGPYYGACDGEADAGDGTCIPTITFDGNVYGECLQAGSATSSCNVLADRPDLADLCGVGSLCETLPDAGASGLCAQQCDPLASPTTCPKGQLCSDATSVTNGVIYSNPHSGQCFPTGSDGCVDGLGELGVDSELVLCTGNASCGCPQTCMDDPGSGSSLCELPCASTADCPTLPTACIKGSCAPNYCDTNYLGAAVPGAFNEPCNAATDGGDGICEANMATDQYGDPLNAYGYCWQTGGANGVKTNGACAFDAIRDAGPTLCDQGDECIATSYDQNGNPIGFSCLSACNPTLADAGCGAGNVCFGTISFNYPGYAPTAGFCYLCSTSGTECAGDDECCSGTCADGGPVNGAACE